MDDHKDRARVEVLTVSDRGRRRRWATAEKVRIVEESFRPDVSASEIARRHEISRSQLYEWRHRYRHGLLGDAPIFSPLIPVAAKEGQAHLSGEADPLPSRVSEQPVLVIDMQKGPSIRVPSGFDIDAVVRLVRGLEGKG